MQEPRANSMSERMSKTTAIFVLWLIATPSKAMPPEQLLNVETRINLSETTIEWNSAEQTTSFSCNLVFTLGGKKAYKDFYYIDSYLGKNNIDIHSCYYRKPGADRQKIPKDAIKKSNAFEQYILCSDKYNVEWTLNNLPVGTIVELDFTTTYKKYLEFIELPLQSTWDIDSTVIHFKHSGNTELAVYEENADSLRIVNAGDDLSIGRIPKWESHKFDGGYHVASASLYCNLIRKDTPYKNWQEVSSTIQGWWKGTKLELPVKKMRDSDLAIVNSIPEDYSKFEDAFRYVAILIGNHGYVPHAPKDVFRYKYGDCKDLSLLFCQLCRENDVEAYPVLVSVPAKNRFFPDIPTPYQFNHCIAAYIIDQDTVYYDPTSRGYLRGEIPWSLQDAYALWLSSETTDLITLPKDTRPIELSRTIEGGVQPNGDFVGQAKIELDSRVPQQRLTVQLSNDELRTLVRMNLSNDVAAVVKDVTLDPANYTISSTVEIKSLTKQIGSKVYISPNIFSYSDPYVDESVSAAGYFMGRPTVYVDSINITLSEMQEMDINEENRFANDLIASEMRWSIRDNQLSGCWRSGFIADHVEVSRSDELNASIDTLRQHRNRRIVLACQP